MTILQAQGLTVLRGDEPLFESVSLSLQAGEVLQIEGSNGSGKTTLLRILCGLGLADEGDILWHGQSLDRVHGKFRESTLYLGHKPGIKAELTPLENLRVYSSIDSNSTEDQRREALLSFGLASKLDVPSGLLSAGQQRRVSLARLSMSKAALWVLDEPLTSLDQSGRDRVAQLLENQAKGGGSVLYSTHQAIPLPSADTRTFRLGVS